ncbi:Type IV secretion system protein virB6, partial [Xanthomonas campestris pv. plantaginis]|nr:Type IV secretion system protein virB6 [Xanthomonas campestris pv. plantaginis]
IVNVPNIAAALWQGNMGTFMAYSAFGAAASPGPQGQPAGSYMPRQNSVDTGAGSENESSRVAATKVTGAPPIQAPAPTGSRGQAAS